MLTKQELSGALLIDKPSGMTSHDVVQQVRKSLNIKRVGHAGTLDPLASGLLVVLLGKATRLQQIFLNSEKAYQGKIRLGVTTDTDDIEGQTIKTESTESFASLVAQQAAIELIKSNFSGVTQQKPPIFSAIKQQGVASYHRARKGESVDLPSREVDIDFQKLTFLNADIIEYEVKVSKGTYIRALARDIGNLLCTGGVIESIKRTKSEPFSIAQAIDLDALKQQNFNLIPMDDLVVSLPQIIVQATQAKELYQGRQEVLEQAEVHSAQAHFAAIVVSQTPKNQLIGIAKRQAANQAAWRVGFLF